MAKKKKAHWIVHALPLVLFLSGVAMLVWTNQVTRWLIHIRRPGTWDLTAATLSHHYESDTFTAGLVCVGLATLWLLLFHRS